MRRPVSGILLLDKPIHTTSNQALQQVKRLFNAKKTGHTGCLDPIATGMLPICFGEATKFSQFLLNANKIYHVTAKLGITTDTGDREGTVTAIKPVIDISHHRITQAMEKFLGEIEQIPPMYSAIKKEGQPLYKLARQGIEVERAPRRVMIYSMKLEECDETDFSMQVHCSKGTYIRTLIEDIGRTLGCGAHVVALRRITITPYDDAPMHTLPTLIAISNQFGQIGLDTCLLPVETSLQRFPVITLSTESAFYMQRGQAVRMPDCIHPDEHALVRLMTEEKQFLGIGEVLADGRVKPARLIAQ